MIPSRPTTCQAEGCEDKAVYDKKYGADLWQIDVEQYDKVSFLPSLALSTLLLPSLSCSLRSTSSSTTRSPPCLSCSLRSPPSFPLLLSPLSSFLPSLARSDRRRAGQCDEVFFRRMVGETGRGMGRQIDMQTDRRRRGEERDDVRSARYRMECFLGWSLTYARDTGVQGRAFPARPQDP